MVDPQDLFGQAPKARQKAVQTPDAPVADPAAGAEDEARIVAASVVPDWNGVAVWLSRVGLDLSPAGLHGTLTGAMIADPHASAARIVPLLGALSPLGEHSESAFVEALEGWRLEVLRSLLDPDLGFSPWLPAAEAPLAARLQALAEWVDGALAGLGQSPRLSGVQLGPEAAEILRDFAAITQVRVDAVDDETSETEWTELVEYVRVASLYLVELFSSDGLQAPIPGARM